MKRRVVIFGETKPRIPTILRDLSTGDYAVVNDPTAPDMLGKLFYMPLSGHAPHCIDDTSIGPPATSGVSCEKLVDGAFTVALDPIC